MVNQRLRVANIAGNTARPHVGNAHRLEDFPLVSIGGNSTAGVASLIIGELTVAGASGLSTKWLGQSGSPVPVAAGSTALRDRPSQIRDAPIAMVQVARFDEFTDGGVSRPSAGPVATAGSKCINSSRPR